MDTDIYLCEVTMDSVLNVIDTKLDDVLQKIVNEASGLSGFPISLVSLVMADVQFLRRTLVYLLI